MAKFPYAKDALRNLFKKPTTEEYPKVPSQAPQNYRGKLKFNENACIGCGMCIRVCSPGAITKTIKKLSESEQQITMKFDLLSCTFCKMCADFCPKKAITLTEDYKMAVTSKEDLVVGGSFIKKLPPKPDPKVIAAKIAAAKAKKAAMAKK